MALLASEQEVQQETKEPLRMEVGDLERKRRREERRRRYDSMLGFLVGWEMDCDRGGISPRSPRTHQKVQREIEQCWQQVERTALDRRRLFHCTLSPRARIKRIWGFYWRLTTAG